MPKRPVEDFPDELTEEEARILEALTVEAAEEKKSKPKQR